MKSASGGLGLIRDGYTNAGAMPPANPSNLGSYVAGMAFIGPAGVAAMDGMHNDFASQVYATLVYDTTTQSSMPTGSSRTSTGPGACSRC